MSPTAEPAISWPAPTPTPSSRTQRVGATAVQIARPHRPVLVAGTLGELTGPTHGLVELPLRLWWGPRGAFDLDEPTMLAWMYENVLREAIRLGELRAYLNGRVLVDVWPDLNLPRAVRAAWETRHPRLRLARSRQAADRLI